MIAPLLMHNAIFHLHSHEPGILYPEKFKWIHFTNHIPGLFIQHSIYFKTFFMKYPKEIPGMKLQGDDIRICTFQHLSHVREQSRWKHRKGWLSMKRNNLHKNLFQRATNKQRIQRACHVCVHIMKVVFFSYLQYNITPS